MTDKAVAAWAEGQGPAEARSGHNQPPSQIEFTEETTKTLGEWIKEHPVIENEEDARAGKLLVDRAKNCVKDLEDERDGQVRPLNTQVKEINARYQAPRKSLEQTTAILLSRLDTYAKNLEQERIRAAEEARRIAEEAARKAHEAENAERLAREEASHGVTTDVAATSLAADAAFSEYKKAAAQARLAEKETKVRITGGFNRALGIRDRETLILVDAIKAINDMGVTERITEAILTDAREYRHITGDLPEGVSVKKERSL